MCSVRPWLFSAETMAMARISKRVAAAGGDRSRHGNMPSTDDVTFGVTIGFKLVTSSTKSLKTLLSRTVRGRDKHD